TADKRRGLSPVVEPAEQDPPQRTAVGGSSIGAKPSLAAEPNKKGSRWQDRKLFIGGGAAGLLLALLGVIVVFENHKGEEQGRIDLPPGTTARVQTNINEPAFQQWVKATQAMRAEKQVEAVAKKLMKLNPGFDGTVTRADGYGAPKIENGI